MQRVNFASVQQYMIDRIKVSLTYEFQTSLIKDLKFKIVESSTGTDCTDRFEPLNRSNDLNDVDSLASLYLVLKENTSLNPGDYGLSFSQKDNITGNYIDTYSFVINLHYMEDIRVKLVSVVPTSLTTLKISLAPLNEETPFYNSKEFLKLMDLSVIDNALSTPVYYTNCFENLSGVIEAISDNYITEFEVALKEGKVIPQSNNYAIRLTTPYKSRTFEVIGMSNVALPHMTHTPPKIASATIITKSDNTLALNVIFNPFMPKTLFMKNNANNLVIMNSNGDNVTKFFNRADSDLVSESSGGVSYITSVRIPFISDSYNLAKGKYNLKWSWNESYIPDVSGILDTTWLVDSAQETTLFNLDFVDIALPNKTNIEKMITDENYVIELNGSELSDPEEVFGPIDDRHHLQYGEYNGEYSTHFGIPILDFDKIQRGTYSFILYHIENDRRVYDYIAIIDIVAAVTPVIKSISSTNIDCVTVELKNTVPIKALEKCVPKLVDKFGLNDFSSRLYSIADSNVWPELTSSVNKFDIIMNDASSIVNGVYQFSLIFFDERTEIFPCTLSYLESRKGLISSIEEINISTVRITFTQPQSRQFLMSSVLQILGTNTDDANVTNKFINLDEALEAGSSVFTYIDIPLRQEKAIQAGRYHFYFRYGSSTGSVIYSYEVTLGFMTSMVPTISMVNTEFSDTATVVEDDVEVQNLQKIELTFSKYLEAELFNKAVVSIVNESTEEDIVSQFRDKGFIGLIKNEDGSTLVDLSSTNWEVVTSRLSDNFYIKGARLSAKDNKSIINRGWYTISFSWPDIPYMPVVSTRVLLEYQLPSVVKAEVVTVNANTLHSRLYFELDTTMQYSFFENLKFIVIDQFGNDSSDKFESIQTSSGIDPNLPEDQKLPINSFNINLIDMTAITFGEYTFAFYHDDYGIPESHFMGKIEISASTYPSIKSIWQTDIDQLEVTLESPIMISILSNMQIKVVRGSGMDNISDMFNSIVRSNYWTENDRETDKFFIEIKSGEFTDAGYYEVGIWNGPIMCDSRYCRTDWICGLTGEIKNFDRKSLSEVDLIFKSEEARKSFESLSLKVTDINGNDVSDKFKSISSAASMIQTDYFDTITLSVLTVLKAGEYNVDFVKSLTSGDVEVFNFGERYRIREVVKLTEDNMDSLIEHEELVSFRYQNYKHAQVLTRDNYIFYINYQINIYEEYDYNPNTSYLNFMSAYLPRIQQIGATKIGEVMSGDDALVISFGPGNYCLERDLYENAKLHLYLDNDMDKDISNYFYSLTDSKTILTKETSDDGIEYITSVTLPFRNSQPLRKGTYLVRLEWGEDYDYMLPIQETIDLKYWLFPFKSAMQIDMDTIRVDFRNPIPGSMLINGDIEVTISKTVTDEDGTRTIASDITNNFKSLANSNVLDSNQTYESIFIKMGNRNVKEADSITLTEENYSNYIGKRVILHGGNVEELTTLYNVLSTTLVTISEDNKSEFYGKTVKPVFSEAGNGKVVAITEDNVDTWIGVPIHVFGPDQNWIGKVVDIYCEEAAAALPTGIYSIYIKTGVFDVNGELQYAYYGTCNVSSMANKDILKECVPFLEQTSYDTIKMNFKKLNKVTNNYDTVPQLCSLLDNLIPIVKNDSNDYSSRFMNTRNANYYSIWVKEKSSVLLSNENIREYEWRYVRRSDNEKMDIVLLEPDLDDDFIGKTVDVFYTAKETGYYGDGSKKVEDIVLDGIHFPIETTDFVYLKLEKGCYLPALEYDICMEYLKERYLSSKLATYFMTSTPPNISSVYMDTNDSTLHIEFGSKPDLVSLEGSAFTIQMYKKKILNEDGSTSLKGRYVTDRFYNLSEAKKTIESEKDVTLVSGIDIPLKDNQILSSGRYNIHWDWPEKSFFPAIDYTFGTNVCAAYVKSALTSAGNSIQVQLKTPIALNILLAMDISVLNESRIDVTDWFKGITESNPDLVALMPTPNPDSEDPLIYPMVDTFTIEVAKGASVPGDLYIFSLSETIQSDETEDGNPANELPAIQWEMNIIYLSDSFPSIIDIDNMSARKYDLVKMTKENYKRYIGRYVQLNESNNRYDIQIFSEDVKDSFINKKVKIFGVPVIDKATVLLDRIVDYSLAEALECKVTDPDGNIVCNTREAKDDNENTDIFMRPYYSNSIQVLKRLIKMTVKLNARVKGSDLKLYSFVIKRADDVDISHLFWDIDDSNDFDDDSTYTTFCIRTDITSDIQIKDLADLKVSIKDETGKEVENLKVPDVMENQEDENRNIDFTFHSSNMISWFDLDLNNNTIVLPEKYNFEFTYQNEPGVRDSVIIKAFEFKESPLPLLTNLTGYIENISIVDLETFAIRFSNLSIPTKLFEFLRIEFQDADGEDISFNLFEDISNVNSFDDASTLEELDEPGTVLMRLNEGKSFNGGSYKIIFWIDVSTEDKNSDINISDDNDVAEGDALHIIKRSYPIAEYEVWNYEYEFPYMFRDMDNSITNVQVLAIDKMKVTLQKAMNINLIRSFAFSLYNPKKGLNLTENFESLSDSNFFGNYMMTASPRKILYSEDGSNWDAYDTRLNYTYTKIIYHEASNSFFALTTNGRIIHFSDYKNGGEAKEVKYSSKLVKKSLNDYVLYERNLVIVGDSGIILKGVIDDVGGITLANLNQDKEITSKNIKRIIQVQNSNTLYAIGDKGLILASYDFGSTWDSTLSIDTKIDFTGILYVDQNVEVEQEDPDLPDKDDDAEESGTDEDDQNVQTSSPSKFINRKALIVIGKKGTVYVKDLNPLNDKDEDGNDTSPSSYVSSFEELEIDTTENFNSIAANSGKIVIVGSGGTFYTMDITEDDFYVSKANCKSKAEYTSVAWCNDKFIACSTSGEVAISFKGNSWKTNVLYGNTNLSSAVYIPSQYGNEKEANWFYVKVKNGYNVSPVNHYSGYDEPDTTVDPWESLDISSSWTTPDVLRNHIGDIYVQKKFSDSEYRDIPIAYWQFEATYANAYEVDPDDPNADPDVEDNELYYSWVKLSAVTPNGNPLRINNGNFYPRLRDKNSTDPTSWVYGPNTSLKTDSSGASYLSPTEFPIPYMTANPGDITKVTLCNSDNMNGVEFFRPYLYVEMDSADPFAFSYASYSIAANNGVWNNGFCSIGMADVVYDGSRIKGMYLYGNSKITTTEKCNFIFGWNWMNNGVGNELIYKTSEFKAVKEIISSVKIDGAAIEIDISDGVNIPPRYLIDKGKLEGLLTKIPVATDYDDKNILDKNDVSKYNYFNNFYSVMLDPDVAIADYESNNNQPTPLVVSEEEYQQYKRLSEKSQNNDGKEYWSPITITNNFIKKIKLNLMEGAILPRAKWILKLRNPSMEYPAVSYAKAVKETETEMLVTTISDASNSFSFETSKTIQASPPTISGVKFVNGYDDIMRACMAIIFETLPNENAFMSEINKITLFEEGDSEYTEVIGMEKDLMTYFQTNNEDIRTETIDIDGEKYITKLYIPLKSGVTFPGASNGTLTLKFLDTRTNTSMWDPVVFKGIKLTQLTTIAYDGKVTVSTFNPNVKDTLALKNENGNTALDSNGKIIYDLTYEDDEAGLKLNFGDNRLSKAVLNMLEIKIEKVTGQSVVECNRGSFPVPDLRFVSDALILFINKEVWIAGDATHTEVKTQAQALRFINAMKRGSIVYYLKDDYTDVTDRFMSMEDSNIDIFEEEEDSKLFNEVKLLLMHGNTLDSGKYKISLYKYFDDSYFERDDVLSRELTKKIIESTKPDYTGSVHYTDEQIQKAKKSQSWYDEVDKKNVIRFKKEFKTCWLTTMAPNKITAKLTVPSNENPYLTITFGNKRYPAKSSILGSGGNAKIKIIRDDSVKRGDYTKAFRSLKGKTTVYKLVKLSDTNYNTNIESDEEYVKSIKIYMENAGALRKGVYDVSFIFHKSSKLKELPVMEDNANKQGYCQFTTSSAIISKLGVFGGVKVNKNKMTLKIKPVSQASNIGNTMAGKILKVTSWGALFKKLDVTMTKGSKSYANNNFGDPKVKGTNVEFTISKNKKVVPGTYKFGAKYKSSYCIRAKNFDFEGMIRNEAGGAGSDKRCWIIRETAPDGKKKCKIYKSYKKAKARVDHMKKLNRIAKYQYKLCKKCMNHRLMSSKKVSACIHKYSVDYIKGSKTGVNKFFKQLVKKWYTFRTIDAKADEWKVQITTKGKYINKNGKMVKDESNSSSKYIYHCGWVKYEGDEIRPKYWDKQTKFSGFKYEEIKSDSGDDTTVSYGCENYTKKDEKYKWKWNIATVKSFPTSSGPKRMHFVTLIWKGVHLSRGYASDSKGNKSKKFKSYLASIKKKVENRLKAIAKCKKCMKHPLARKGGKSIGWASALFPWRIRTLSRMSSLPTLLNAKNSEGGYKPDSKKKKKKTKKKEKKKTASKTGFTTATKGAEKKKSSSETSYGCSSANFKWAKTTYKKKVYTKLKCSGCKSDETVGVSTFKGTFIK